MAVGLVGMLFNESEDYITSLSKSSAKLVNIVCPMCGDERVLRYYKVKEIGHTYCKSCAKRKRSCDDMLGKKFGRLTVTSYADKHFESGGTLMNCVCDCGKKVSVSASHLKDGHTSSCGCFRIENLLGDKNPTYNPNLTEQERNSFRTRVQTWAKRVKERDGFTCQVCGSNSKLIAHHLNSYASDKDKRIDIDNGVTMCRDCHTDFHVNFMGNYRVPCTEQDFEEYLLQV